MPQVTLTIDLEDETEQYAPNGRYANRARHILDICNETNTKATFFTIGKLATASPDLIKEITKQGHEIAYHSHAHISLTEEEPTRLREQSRTDKDLLQQLSGTQVIGYRAPRYSLTPSSMWALDILAENGFQYSSSIMPTSLSRFGFTDTPTTPFRWPNGMIEFPLPVKKIGHLSIPYLGGIYLYALPFWLSNYWRETASENERLWTYAHPYDFDRNESFHLMPNTPAWISFVLWLARRFAEPKIKRVIRGGASAPMQSLLSEILAKPVLNQ